MCTLAFRLFSLSAALLLATTVSHAAPRALDGIVDLTAWSFQSGDIATLDGEWEFYWSAFLSPQAPESPEHTSAPRKIVVPGAWNAYRGPTGKPVGGDGFATYRLRILLPSEYPKAGAPGDPSPSDLAVYVPYVNTSYELWIDGELKASNGVLGRTRSQGEPQFRPQIAVFTPKSNQVDLVLHVSNFHFRNGGIPRSLELGAADQIILKQRRLEATGAVLFGAALIMAIFFAGIYALRRENVADAYFSLFLFSIATRILVTGDHVLARVLPGSSWELALKIEYITTYLSPALFLYFVRALFPQDVSGLVVRAWTFVAAAGSVITLVFPGRVSSQLIPAYMGLLAILLLYLVYVGIRTAIRQRSDALLFVWGMAATVACVLVTLLRYADIVNVVDLVPLGATIMILTQALILARRSARSHRQAVALAAENAHMLEKTEWQLAKLKEYRRLMTLREENLRRRIAETLHGRTQGRLFAALRRIELAQATMAQDTSKAGEHLSDAKALIDQVREEDIRTTGKQLHPTAVGAGIVAAVESLLDSFEESVQVHFDVDPAVEALDQPESGLPYDLRLGIYRIVEEGLNNISKHAKASAIRVSLALDERHDGESRVLNLTLTDDGVGFDPDQRASMGLGLQTIDARVGDLGGEWTFTGAPGKGATLRVSIPLPPSASTRIA